MLAARRPLGLAAFCLSLSLRSKPLAAHGSAMTVFGSRCLRLGAPYLAQGRYRVGFEITSSFSSWPSVDFPGPALLAASASALPSRHGIAPARSVLDWKAAQASSMQSSEWATPGI